MVTKKELRGLNMSIEEYFEYLLESKNNGQHVQAKVMFNAMSEGQQKYFFEYIDTLLFYEVDMDEMVSEMIDFRNYFKL
jgi:hypothetical protein